MRCQRKCSKLLSELLIISLYKMARVKTAVSISLFQNIDDWIDFNYPYFTSHLITYIGNKRKLLPFLNSAFIDVKRKLGKRKIDSLDGFSGSGVVSRLLKYHSNYLISNDFENYTETINKAYLANKGEVDIGKLIDAVNFLNVHKLDKTKSDYFISKNYAPEDELDIKHGERVFYTPKNARIIDNIKYLIDAEVDPTVQIYCKANLLIRSSVHTNTSGVFKGFHKRNGKGHFGGHGENALSRIKREISLEIPIFSEVECDVEVRKEDLNKLVLLLPEVDIAYFDPPYNQHPYGSNYFMLNLINNGGAMEIQKGVSGIVENWQRSDYNKTKSAIAAMDQLLEDTKAKFIVISYNSEGIIPIEIFKSLLSKHGDWQLYEQEYNTYRGSRNLRNRSIKVQELLWVLQKS